MAGKKLVVTILAIVAISCALLIGLRSAEQTISLDKIGTLQIPASWECRNEKGLYSIYDENGTVILMQIARSPSNDEIYGIVNHEKLIVSSLSYAYGDINYSNSSTFGFCNCIIDNKQNILPYIKIIGADYNSDRLLFLVLEPSLSDKVLQRITKSFKTGDGSWKT